MGRRFLLTLAAVLAAAWASGAGEAAERDVNREAMELVNEFMERLKQDVPFTYEEGERFFPDNLSFTRGGLMILLGYESGLGRVATKPMPRFSPLCEWLRINREKFLPEFPEYPQLFASRILTPGDGGALVPDHYESYLPFGVGVAYFSLDITRDSPMLTFFYSEEERCLLIPFLVNGRPVDAMLGFDLDKLGDPDDEPDDGAFKEMIRQLEAHLAKLEETTPRPEVF